MFVPYEIIYFGIGFIAALVLLFVLYIVYLYRTKSKTTTSSDLQQIKSIIENNYILDEKPKYKLIKGIEVIDLDDEKTDAKGNSE